MYSTIIKYGITASMATLSASEILEYRMMHGDDIVEPPVDTVSIIMPSLNEEKYIENSLDSIRNQSIIQMYPEYFEVILIDSGSKDKTVDLARPYVDKILTAGKGKLTARATATEQSNGNIIVAVDADCVYLFHWLNTLLKPFKDPATVATLGSTFDSSMPFVPGKLFTLADFVDKRIIHSTKITGRNSAYWKHLYNLTGKFNTDINQLDQHIIQKEEEYDFGKRLSNFGNIVYNLNAACIHYGGEKGGCRLGLLGRLLSNNCNKYKIGIERFG